MKELSLYIHIPFCNKSKCSYCSFVSFCDRTQTIDRYIECLVREMKMYEQDFFEYKVKTIFIGGGTPSVLDIFQVNTIFAGIRKHFNVDTNAEITIECNIDTLSEEKLLAYKNLGINRISIGAQTMNDDVLHLIGRRHSADDIINTVKLIKKVGFNSFNVDMMVGLPSQTLDDVRKMASYLAMQKVPHVSCYSLILEEGTPLYEAVARGEVSLPSEDETVNMYDEAERILQQNGIKRYEVSNFASSGNECRHNLCYWRGGEYLGLGVSAHSLIDGERFSNFQDLDEYLDVVTSGEKPINTREVLTLSQKREEYILLSLRTREGIDLDEFKEMFSEDLSESHAEEIKFLTSHNLININDKYLSVADSAYYVLDSIILKLI